MESRGPEDSKNVKTSQAYFFEGFISFFEDFSLTRAYNGAPSIALENYLSLSLFNSVSASKGNDWMRCQKSSRCGCVLMHT